MRHGTHALHPSAWKGFSAKLDFRFTASVLRNATVLSKRSSAPSVPLAIEVERRSCWGPQRRHLRRPPGSASTELEQPLDVLPRGGHQDLAVRPLQRPEPHPLHPMPLLGFAEERLDPHLPLAHGLLARLGFVVGAHPLCVALVEASA